MLFRSKRLSFLKANPRPISLNEGEAHKQSTSRARALRATYPTIEPWKNYNPKLGKHLRGKRSTDAYILQTFLRTKYSLKTNYSADD